jgi:Zn finger protein HypA/HybF involved in hydrogenase expression
MDDFLGHNYTAAQQAEANAPPCPQCGSTNVTVSWQETTDHDSSENTWTPTLVTCGHCGSQAAVGLRAT